jgi:hypothetical protein
VHVKSNTHSLHPQDRQDGRFADEALMETDTGRDCLSRRRARMTAYLFKPALAHLVSATEGHEPRESFPWWPQHATNGASRQGCQGWDKRFRATGRPLAANLQKTFERQPSHHDLATRSTQLCSLEPSPASSPATGQYAGWKKRSRGQCVLGAGLIIERPAAKQRHGE